MKLSITFFLLSMSLSGFSQEKDYLYAVYDTVQNSLYSYYITSAKGDTLKKLSKDKYLFISNNRAEKFFVAGIKGYKGWQAIDKDLNVLFEVYNESYGEPTPDYLRGGFIRILDTLGNIGFANEKGDVVIRPQFSFASPFDNKHAIIAMECKLIFDEHAKEGDCVHPALECKKWGYINKKGEIRALGNHTFDSIAKKIKWKLEEEVLEYVD